MPRADTTRSGDRATTDRRGQAHTLEAFTAALVVLGGVAFALQATAVTPLSASTSNQYIENQQRDLAVDVLETTAADGTLERIVAATNESRVYHEAPNDPFGFGDALNATFGSRTIAYNVHVRYYDENGRPHRWLEMVYMGTPSDNAVSVSRYVTLFDDTPVPGSNENVSAAYSEFKFASDADPDGPLYNVAEVRMVVWRI